MAYTEEKSSKKLKDMTQKIELFLFILSIVFCSRFIIEFIAALREDSPTPLKVSKNEKIFLYFASAYIITFLINIFLK